MPSQRVLIKKNHRKMKQLNLNNTDYQYLEHSFKEWLEALGYARSTAYYLPNHIREFLAYLEGKKVNHIELATRQHINNYLETLSKRPNKRQSGGISVAYINKHMQALKNFSVFLRESRQIILPVELTAGKPLEKTIKVLTKKEIERLYNLCGNDSFGQRDQAMLDICYGCGLRREEAAQLEVKDLLLTKKLLLVRKAKNQRQRYVPVNMQITENLNTYLKQGRKALLSPKNLKENAFFISKEGKRLSSQSLALRLRKLTKKAGLENVGLHTLRHTIATHLLQSGMPLEDISMFLGHQSLESTQIYTHLSA
jgi:integrase/recombinase XerD